MIKYAALLLSATIFCGNAIADDGCSPFYASVSGGLSFLQETTSGDASLDYDAGRSMNAAIGWYEQSMRLEFEATKMNMDVNSVAGINATSGNVDLDAWMLSGYYDTPITNSINGYVGVGGGFARISANSLADGFGGFINATSELGLAYQARVGVSKEVTRRSEVFGGYRFLGTEAIDIAENNLNVNGVFSDTLLTHSLEFGLRFKF